MLQVVLAPEESPEPDLLPMIAVDTDQDTVRTTVDRLPPTAATWGVSPL